VQNFVGLSALISGLAGALSVPIASGVVAGGLFSWGGWQPIEGVQLSAVDIRPQWESAWVRETIAKDPAAEAIVAQYVSGLSAAGYQTDRQGVWVAAGQYPIAQHQGNTRHSAASITKVATTLAALETWGAEHRFETLVGYQGSVTGGVLQGDLIIEGGNDPLFVWEEAIALANALQQAGISRVTGDLIIAGSFNMNFETSPQKSGALLQEAFNRERWGYDVERAYLDMPQGTATPSLRIEGQVRAAPNSWRNRASGWLISHQSLPLVAILKAMNIYSNNPMAEQVADAVGGPEAVMRSVQAATGIPADEISLTNGSGLGEANQMSARAAVALFQKIHYLLRSSSKDGSGISYTISDIFPVSGADGGTIRDRGIPGNAVVKTGSLAVVSALAGALPTKNRGVVWFSLLNYGNGLDNLRSRQDQVISALERQWGQADEIPPELATTVNIGVDPYRFGDARRNLTLEPTGSEAADS